MLTEIKKNQLRKEAQAIYQKVASIMQINLATIRDSATQKYLFTRNRELNLDEIKLKTCLQKILLMADSSKHDQERLINTLVYGFYQPDYLEKLYDYFYSNYNPKDPNKSIYSLKREIYNDFADFYRDKLERIQADKNLIVNGIIKELIHRRIRSDKETVFSDLKKRLWSADYKDRINPENLDRHLMELDRIKWAVHSPVGGKPDRFMNDKQQQFIKQWKKLYTTNNADTLPYDINIIDSPLITDFSSDKSEQLGDYIAFDYFIEIFFMDVFKLYLLGNKDQDVSVITRFLQGRSYQAGRELFYHLAHFLWEHAQETKRLLGIYPNKSLDEVLKKEYLKILIALAEHNTGVTKDKYTYPLHDIRQSWEKFRNDNKEYSRQHIK